VSEDGNRFSRHRRDALARQCDELRRCTSTVGGVGSTALRRDKEVKGPTGVPLICTVEKDNNSSQLISLRTGIYIK
jgi:hypothetical protein